MADVTFTPANVLENSGAVVRHGNYSGGAVPAGRIVYKNSSGLFVTARADTLVNSGSRTQLYIALNTADAANQPLSLLESGDITGNGLTAGKMYFLSNNAGGLLMPAADMVLAVGAYLVPVGVAVSTTVLRVLFNNSGIVIV
jgi:hypothetical protein